MSLTAPPKYIEKFDNSNDILKDLEIKLSKLQENQQRRLVPKFDDEENKKIEKIIDSLVKEMTSKLYEVENKIKEMVNENTNNDIDENIKNNMKQTIYTKLSEFTKKFKMNQEIYMKKFRELVGNENLYNNNNNYNESDNNNSKKENFLVLSEETNVLQKRDKEFGNLLKSVNELASIFKDMQNLVMQQGTILDRIDYNIENAAVKINQGKKNLEKTEEIMKKSCYRKVMFTLLIIIFIEIVLLLFKFL
jgi:syntaxin 16